MQLLRGLLFGLGAASLTAGPTMAAAADAPAAVASIKPIHSLLAGVMEGVGRPALLVPGGASPHGYSLRPSDAHALEDADLVVWTGEQIEAFMKQPLRSLAGDAFVLELVRAEGIALLPMREGGIWDEHDHHGEGDHADEHDAHDEDEEHGAHAHHEDEDKHDAHDEDEAHGTHAHHEDEDKHDAHDEDEEHGAHAHHEDEDEHGHHDDNMHIWLDPVTAATIVEAMADALILVDPERTARYRDNAAALQARLQALDAELEETLAPVRDRGFLVFHDAWQYFDTRYGLHAVGSTSVSPERAPGAARLAEIRQVLADRGADCVFAEPQFEPRLVQTLVADTGTATGTLDPLGATIEEGPDLYFTLMRSNAAAFRACFGE